VFIIAIQKTTASKMQILFIDACLFWEVANRSSMLKNCWPRYKPNLTNESAFGLDSGLHNLPRLASRDEKDGKAQPASDASGRAGSRETVARNTRTAGPMRPGVGFPGFT
jgi:hypothetical protein